MIRHVLLWLTIAALAGVAHAESQHVFHSGEQQTVMIELYTSQGCSSCPPAEAYLNRFKDNAQLWRRYVPMAFHVDYWDYLGWKDRFAKAAFSRRQRDYARHHQATTVYTPAFVVNGEFWHGLRTGQAPRATGRRPGQLTLRVDDSGAQLRFEPRMPVEGKLVFNLAVLGMGFETDINAGERAGGHPRNDFVVLAHVRHPSDDLKWQAPLPAISGSKPSRLALVAWVSRPGDPSPLQATGGYVPVHWVR